MNWKWLMQTCGALVTYLALMGAYLAGLSPLEFALYSAVLLCLGLTVYSMTAALPKSSKPEPSLQSVVSSVSESMAELHSLQNEINELQAQFDAETKVHRIAPGGSAV